MAKLKLPGSSLLDRCIGRSSFQYDIGIAVKPFQHNISYGSFLKIISKYEPKQRVSWFYTTPFGRMDVCRHTLSSSKRTVCLHHDDADGDGDNKSKPSNMEVYEYCVGSIRNSVLTVNSRAIIPPSLIEKLHTAQFKATDYCTKKWPDSTLTALLHLLVRSKCINAANFTSTPVTFFPKWCSSISLVRVLKATDVDPQQLIEQLNKESNPNDELKGKSKVNLSKDIDHELEKENAEKRTTTDADAEQYTMKQEYQSDLIRHYDKLIKFDVNYECDEMYLIHSTRYQLFSESGLVRLFFLPHWLSVQWISNLMHRSVLEDIANNLEFVAHKDAEDEVDRVSSWHKERPRRVKNKIENVGASD